jgi:outer membrane protein assembly factor BamD
MFRRITIVVLVGLLLCLGIACHKKKKAARNPLDEIDSTQPEKVLFDKAMDAMKHKKWERARLNLQTLINTYPDSEYIARAKMGVGDAWLAEGGAAALTQAESEFKDFITFFPNMPEAAEAQMKIADIHFKQMGKPDRDFTHAKRAEQECRQLLLQFPDSELAEKARVRLLQVQEILAEREYYIGRIYHLRENWPASVARFKTLTETYPLFSKADDALYMLGDSYEHLAQWAKTAKIDPQTKARLIREDNDGAAAAYSRILTRYPVMPRAADAAKRLEAMNRPVPKATPEAIELNKREQAGRGERGFSGKPLRSMRRRPDLRLATKVGQPTLVDPPITNPAKFVQEANEALRASKALPPGKRGKGSKAIPQPPADPFAKARPAPDVKKPAKTKSSDTPAAAPPQADEAKAAPNQGQGENFQTDSSSKPKKKKHGLRKLIPF